MHRHEINDEARRIAANVAKSQPRRSDRSAKTATQTSEIGGYGEVRPGAGALTHATGHTGPRRGEETLAEAHLLPRVDVR